MCAGPLSVQLPIHILWITMGRDLTQVEVYRVVKFVIICETWSWEERRWQDLNELYNLKMTGYQLISGLVGIANTSKVWNRMQNVSPCVATLHLRLPLLICHALLSTRTNSSFTNCVFILWPIAFSYWSRIFAKLFIDHQWFVISRNVPRCFSHRCPQIRI